MEVFSNVAMSSTPSKRVNEATAEIAPLLSPPPNLAEFPELVLRKILFDLPDHDRICLERVSRRFETLLCDRDSWAHLSELVIEEGLFDRLDRTLAYTRSTADRLVLTHDCSLALAMRANLRRLAIRDVSIRVSTLRALLFTCPQLEYLSLAEGCCLIADDGSRVTQCDSIFENVVLSELKQLQVKHSHLRFDRPELARDLTRFPILESLELHGSFSLDFLSAVATGLQNLKCLCLLARGGESLKHPEPELVHRVFGNLSPSVENLNVSLSVHDGHRFRFAPTHSSLPHLLNRLPNLKALALRSSNVFDADLALLAGLSKLKYVLIRWNNATRAGIRTLCRARPENAEQLTIIVRTGAGRPGIQQGGMDQVLFSRCNVRVLTCGFGVDDWSRLQRDFPVFWGESEALFPELPAYKNFDDVQTS